MVKIKNRTLLFFLVLWSVARVGHAQSEPDSTQYDDQVSSLVNFYKYMLNTVGAAETTTRDKEVIIKESYKKIFAHPDVQIEDDLVPDRKVILHKEVSAYLRDIDFFFNEIAFDFEQVQIEKLNKEDGSFYFLVSFDCSIKGITIDEENYSSIKKRFIEVNLDEATGDLKIASVYNTKVSRAMELQSWWESLSYQWMAIFTAYVPHDSLSVDVWLQMTALDSINLSGDQFIQDLEPLVALKKLSVVDISHTQIRDLSPLRFAKNLRKLSAGSTPITDLAPLQYFEKLSYLDLSRTRLSDISVLAQCQQLSHLNLSETTVSNFDVLKALTQLVEIDLSGTLFVNPTLLSGCTALQTIHLSKTLVSQLAAIQTLTSLRYLDVSETAITDLKGLEDHPQLEEVLLNRTSIGNLDIMLGCENLKKVYADFTDVTERMASTFMAKKPQTVVVTNSAEIMHWWTTLPVNWRIIFEKRMDNKNPDKEDIIKLMNLDSLDVSNQHFYKLDPLKKFQRLKYLDVSHNLFTSFEFTENMEDLEVLVATHLPVDNTKGLENNLRLKLLDLRATMLKDLSGLNELAELEVLDADETPLPEDQVIKYLKKHPQTVVIYQSAALESWWDSLTDDWKTALNLDIADSFHLHRLIEQKELEISGLPITSLSALRPFIQLEKIILDRTQLTSLEELFGHHPSLQSLSCTNGPLQSIAGIEQLGQLESLDISNTAIEDLRDLSGLSQLKHLNGSGTGIKNLKALARLYELESLDVSNTRIWRLEWLYDMKNLKKLICNNTRLNDRKVADFREIIPACEVTFY